MPRNPRRVLLVDEGPSEARGSDIADIAEILTAAGFSVRVVSAGEPPNEVAARYRPDVAVVSLGDGLGVRAPAVSAIVRGLERDYGVPVVVVESRRAPSHDGDVRGDRLEPPGPSVLGARLRERTLAESSALAAGDVVVDEAGRVALRNDRLLSLTRLEFDLLAHFVRHRNRVLTREALLAAVWHNEPVTPNAIEALVSKLRAKLDAHGPRIVHTIRGVGYVLRIEGTSPFQGRPRPHRAATAAHDGTGRRWEVSAGHHERPHGAPAPQR